MGPLRPYAIGERPGGYARLRQKPYGLFGEPAWNSLGEYRRTRGVDSRLPPGKASDVTRIDHARPRDAELGYRPLPTGRDKAAAVGFGELARKGLGYLARMGREKAQRGAVEGMAHIEGQPIGTLFGDAGRRFWGQEGYNVSRANTAANLARHFPGKLDLGQAAAAEAAAARYSGQMDRLLQTRDLSALTGHEAAGYDRYRTLHDQARDQAQQLADPWRQQFGFFGQPTFKVPQTDYRAREGLMAGAGLAVGGAGVGLGYEAMQNPSAPAITDDKGVRLPPSAGGLFGQPLHPQQGGMFGQPVRGPAPAGPPPPAPTAGPPPPKPDPTDPNAGGWGDMLGGAVDYVKDRPWQFRLGAAGVGGGLLLLRHMQQRRAAERQRRLQEALMAKAGAADPFADLARDCPVAAGVLAYCGDAGYGAAEIRHTVIKAAGLVPGLDEEFERLFGGAAGSLSRVPDAIRPRVKSAQGPGEPEAPEPRGMFNQPPRPQQGGLFGQPLHPQQGGMFGQPPRPQQGGMFGQPVARRVAQPPPPRPSLTPGLPGAPATLRAPTVANPQTVGARADGSSWWDYLRTAPPHSYAGASDVPFGQQAGVLAAGGAALAGGPPLAAMLAAAPPAATTAATTAAATATAPLWRRAGSKVLELGAWGVVPPMAGQAYSTLQGRAAGTTPAAQAPPDLAGNPLAQAYVREQDRNVDTQVSSGLLSPADAEKVKLQARFSAKSMAPAQIEGKLRDAGVTPPTEHLASVGADALRALPKGSGPQVFQRGVGTLQETMRSLSAGGKIVDMDQARPELEGALRDMVGGLALSGDLKEDPEAMIKRIAADGVTPNEALRLAQDPGNARIAGGPETPLAQKVQNIQGFFENPEVSGVHKAMLGIGVPMAILGLLASVFGDGGLGGLLMSALGLGAAAYGAQQGGLLQGLFGGAGGAPAAGGGAPAAGGGAPAAGGGGFTMSPAMRQAFMDARPEVRMSLIQEQLDQHPEQAPLMEQAYQGWNAKLPGLLGGGGMPFAHSLTGDKIREQLKAPDLTDDQIQAYLDAYRAARPEPAAGPGA